jgi:5-methylcytosine-specific restriction protein B
MCLIHGIKDEDFKKQYFSNTVNEYATNSDIKFPLSLEKICRMHQSAIDHGFASYAEA